MISQKSIDSDISPENILIDNNDNPVLIDFDMSLKIPQVVQGCQLRRCRFTPQGRSGKKPYMAPETYNNEAFDGVMVDVWLIGTTTIAMLASQLPYDRPTIRDAKYQLLTSNLNVYLQDCGVTVSPPLIDLLKWMLKVNPQDRPSLEQILQHEALRILDDSLDK
jgi:serine/threonine protein kinase